MLITVINKTCIWLKRPISLSCIQRKFTTYIKVHHSQIIVSHIDQGILISNVKIPSPSQPVPTQTKRHETSSGVERVLYPSYLKFTKSR